MEINKQMDGWMEKNVYADVSDDPYHGRHLNIQHGWTSHLST